MSSPPSSRWLRRQVSLIVSPEWDRSQTNDAFSAVSTEILDYLASNIAALTEVLSYHFLEGRSVPFGEHLDNNGEFETLNGDPVAVENNIINEGIKAVGSTF